MERGPVRQSRFVSLPSPPSTSLLDSLKSLTPLPVFTENSKEPTALPQGSLLSPVLLKEAAAILFSPSLSFLDSFLSHPHPSELYPNRNDFKSLSPLVNLLKELGMC